MALAECSAAWTCGKNSNEADANERTPLNYLALPAQTIFWPPASAITGLGDYMRARGRERWTANQPNQPASPYVRQCGRKSTTSLSLANASRSLRLFAGIDRAATPKSARPAQNHPYGPSQKKVSVGTAPNGRVKWKIIPIPFHASPDWK